MDASNVERDRPGGHRRAWFLALGLTLVVLGGAVLCSSLALTLFATLVVGPALLVTGLLQVLLGLFAPRWEGSFLHLMAGAVEGVVGLLVLAQPVDAGADVVLLVAAALMAGGVFHLLGSLLLRPGGRRWLLAGGAAAVLLGVVLWRQWISSELWVLGLCVGLDFLCRGTSWMMLSWTRRAGDAPLLPVEEDAAVPVVAEASPASFPPPPASSPAAESTPGDEAMLGYEEKVEKQIHGYLKPWEEVIQQEGRALRRVDRLIEESREKEKRLHEGSL